MVSGPRWPLDPDLRTTMFLDLIPSRPPLLALALAAGLASSLAAAQADYVSYPLLPQDVASSHVVDRQGRYVGRILPQKRYWVPLERIPPFLQQAVVAVEDARFYEHGGIDLKGIARALLKDVVKGKLVEGGSTITQQLIKNKFLSSEVSLDRKVKEARMAMEFEKKYTKSQILEMYFNEIYFGNGAWGIAQAARLYFDKRPDELSEAECLLLAGVPKNPGRYNPWGPVPEVTRRRDVVLQRLAELELATPQKVQAMKARLPKIQGQDQARSYLGQIRGQLVTRYGAEAVELGGLDVTAALDLQLQKQAELALRDGAARISPELQGAFVCMDPVSGDVLASVGGVKNGLENGGLDRAFTSLRQSGSAIKPLIYAAALEKGITASSLWSDARVSYAWGNGQSWSPRNYGGESFGVIPLRQALAHSDNIITVKVLDTVGVPAFMDFAARDGLALRAQNGLSLALGTSEVTLGGLVQAYTALANGGIRAEARSILKIYDHRHQAWTEIAPASAQAMTPGAAFVTTQMLKDVLVYGTAKSLRKFSEAHPAAGKTGTTDDYVDAWFVGYTPQLIAGVWLGMDRPRPLGPGFTGGAAAAPIWQRFMAGALGKAPGDDFPIPDDVTIAVIDPASGDLAVGACPERADEYYLSGTEPTQPCPLHSIPENSTQP